MIIHPFQITSNDSHLTRFYLQTALALAAGMLLSSCGAYMELAREDKANVAYIKDARYELAMLQQERTVLLERRSALQAELASLERSRAPRTSSRSGAGGSTRNVAVVRQELRETEQRISENARQLAMLVS